MFVRIINSLPLGQWVKKCVLLGRETLTFTRSLLSEGLDRFIFSSSQYYACSYILFHNHEYARAHSKLIRRMTSDLVT